MKRVAKSSDFIDSSRAAVGIETRVTALIWVHYNKNDRTSTDWHAGCTLYSQQESHPGTSMHS